jgi:hypothetical protein
MRPEAETALAVLKAKLLWVCRRSGFVSTFHFGAHHTVPGWLGQATEVGDFALRIQCPWRVVRKDRILVGSDDIFFPADYSSDIAPPLGFDWERQNNRRDKLVSALFEPGRPALSVRKIETSFAGSFRLLFDDKMLLEVVPISSRRVEHWRLLRPQSDEPLFVFTGQQAEE